MHASVISSWLGRLAGTIALVIALHPAARSENLPIYRDVEFQPLSAQVKRVVDALELLGEPLGTEDKARINRAIDSSGGDEPIRVMQQVLDKRCLIGIEINPESRVKAAQGPAVPRLVQNGWSVFLVKVHNEAGVTARLASPKPQLRTGLPAIDQSS